MQHFILCLQYCIVFVRILRSVDDMKKIDNNHDKKVSSCRMAACDCQITSSHKTGNTKWVILKMISNLFKVQSKSLIESDSMPVSALH